MPTALEMAQHLLTLGASAGILQSQGLWSSIVDPVARRLKHLVAEEFSA
jgi:hypothetical protein